MRNMERQERLAELLEAGQLLSRIERHIAQAALKFVPEVGFIFESDSQCEAFGIVHVRLLSTNFEYEELGGRL